MRFRLKILCIFVLVEFFIFLFTSFHLTHTRAQNTKFNAQWFFFYSIEDNENNGMEKFVHTHQPTVMCVLCVM